MICLFYYTHPSGCKVVSHRDFDSHILEDDDIEHLFQELIGHWYIFKEMSIQILYPF